MIPLVLYALITLFLCRFFYLCTKPDYANLIEERMQKDFEIILQCISTCELNPQLDSCKELKENFIRKHSNDPDILQYNYLVGMLTNKISEKTALLKRKK